MPPARAYLHTAKVTLRSFLMTSRTAGNCIPCIPQSNCTLCENLFPFRSLNLYHLSAYLFFLSIPLRCNPFHTNVAFLVSLLQLEKSQPSNFSPRPLPSISQSLLFSLVFCLIFGDGKTHNAQVPIFCLFPANPNIWQ